VFGWVEDMRTLMAACDVVIDNACGTTAKEALRLGVPVVTFRPIAGHGRDDALAMAALGLTELVDDEPALEAALARLQDPRTRAARVGRGKELFVEDAAARVADVARGHAARAGR
jgi:UDP-N-acetylglucosamine:LPS N-acetylglucosamine transferase